MKKITITLGNNESKFTTMVDTDTAKRVFGETICSLIGETNKVVEKEATKKDTEVKSKKANFIDNLQKSAKNRMMVREAIANMETKPKATPYEPYAENKAREAYSPDPNKKFLCYYECRGCDKKFFKMANFGEQITCSCGEKSEIEHFTQGIYKCDCCGFNGFFKVVNGSDVSEITCKGCDGPIDMKYNTDKKQWLSLNMFR